MEAAAQSDEHKNGFPCTSCGKRLTRVVDSRPTANSIRRRRHCVACGTRFNTYEIFAEDAVLTLAENYRALITDLRETMERHNKRTEVKP